MMDLRTISSKPPLVRYLFAFAIAIIALAIQWLIHPLTDPDSYQVFLGAVALSVIYGGSGAGFLTLGIAATARFYFFVLPHYSLATQGHIVASQMLLFLGVGLVICSIGGKLRTSEETLSAVLASIGDAVIALDDKGYIRFINPVGQNLIGWKEDVAVGKSIGEVICLVNADTGESVASPTDGVLQGRGATPIADETVLVARAGRRVPVEGSASSIHDPAGNVKGAVMVLRDITARKRSERERENLIGQLREALAKVKHLSGLLPICASCKKIRDDKGYWHQLESYIRSHSEAEFSHGICPDCMKKLYPDIVLR